MASTLALRVPSRPKAALRVPMGGSLALPKLLMDTAILSPGRMEEVRPTTLTAWGRRSLLGWDPDLAATALHRADDGAGCAAPARR